MRRKILQYAVLVSLSGACPAWAGSGASRVPTAPGMASSSLDVARPEPVVVPAPPRGKLLYENHCMSCHESMVHIRTRQQVRSLAALQNQVSRWALHLQLRWSSEDLNDVVAYLNRQYYQFESR